MRNDADTARYYVLRLTDGERGVMCGALREREDEAGGEVRGALATRLERERGEDDLLSLATDRLRAWYYSRVRDLAEDVLGRVLDGTLADAEALDSDVWETVDSTDIVVYTFKAKCALLASDNEDALGDETGEGGTVEARAFWALRADVLERLRAMVEYGAEGVELPEGFDPDDEETWPANAPKGEGEEVTP